MSPPTSEAILALTPADPSKPSFADLPAEIRNEIYLLVAASFPYSLTFTGRYRKQAPFYDVHPLVRLEFESLFFSMPRTYIFHIRTANHERRAAAFLNSSAASRIFSTKRSKIELVDGRVVHKGRLSSGEAVQLAKRIKTIADLHIYNEYARMRAGGSATGRDAKYALTSLTREMNLICRKDSSAFFPTVGRVLCSALSQMVCEWPVRSEKLYIDIAVVFKETKWHGITLQGCSDPMDHTIRSPRNIQD